MRTVRIGHRVAGFQGDAAERGLVSQGVGMAIGVQDSFSWKSVAVAALSAGVTQGIAAAWRSLGFEFTHWFTHQAAQRTRAYIEIDVSP
jgi:hypothetical protein